MNRCCSPMNTLPLYHWTSTWTCPPKHTHTQPPLTCPICGWCSENERFKDENTQPSLALASKPYISIFNAIPGGWREALVTSGLELSDGSISSAEEGGEGKKINQKKKKKKKVYRCQAYPATKNASASRGPAEFLWPICKQTPVAPTTAVSAVTPYNINLINVPRNNNGGKKRRPGDIHNCNQVWQRCQIKKPT